MKTKILLFIPFLFMFISSCQKAEEDNELPPATQTGANTFGCKINGVNWIANGSNDMFYPQALWGGISGIDTSASGTGQEYKLRLSLSAYDLNRTSFDLVVGCVPNVGTYLLNKTTRPEPAEVQYKSYGGFSGMGGWYMTDSTHTGSITITKYDRDNFILSGTFQFDALDKLTGKVIHVTDGRFDSYLCKQ